MIKKTIYFFSTLVIISCSKDANELSNEPERNQTYSADISGSLAKGAYITGSDLTFFELNDILSQTGKSYNTNIKDDFGAFDLSVEQITESFARVVGNGFYWNEMTNQTTAEKLTLNSVVEVKDNINVNVLTHMGYERVIELVKNQSKSFDEAKKQALSEVLKVFDIKAPAGNQKSEEYNFREGNEASKILLVISCVVQAGRNTAQVSALITKIANDIKDNGVLDDNMLKTDIARQLYHIDFQDVISNVLKKYKNINENLDDSSFSSEYLKAVVASFQGYLSDGDSDGVQDELDQCSDTQEGVEVDENGCSKEQRTYEVKIILDGNGHVLLGGSSYFINFQKEYSYGATLDLTAYASSGWKLQQWSGSIESNKTSYQLTVESDMVINAIFKPQEFQIEIAVEGEGKVKLSPEQDTYDFESIIELTAIPDEGWTFERWYFNEGEQESFNPANLTVGFSNSIRATFSDEYPTDSPSAPTHEASEVISVYSDHYTSNLSSEWLFDIKVTEKTIQNNSVLSFDLIDFSVVALRSDEDFSQITHLQFDYWSKGHDVIRLLINQWPDEIYRSPEITIEKGEWNRVTLELSEELINKIKTTGFFDMVFLEEGFENEEKNKLCIDNIYFF
jgi:superoxide dismutase